MRTKRMAVWTALSFILLGSALLAQAQSATSSSLRVRIVSGTRPVSVQIVRRDGPPFSTVEMAPEKQQWLSLAVEVGVPEAGTWLAAEGIQVIDRAGKSHPALGVAIGEPIGKEFFYSLFADANTLAKGGVNGHMNKDHQLVFACMKLDSGDAGISFQQAQPTVVRLLFAVPPASTSLQLQVVSGPKLAIPAR